MVAIIGGIRTLVRISMKPPERDLEKQKKQDEEALLAAGIDLSEMNSDGSAKAEESAEDAAFRKYYEQKLREQADDNYWGQVGSGNSDFGGYSRISTDDDATIAVDISGCSYNVAKHIGNNADNNGDKPVFISVVGNDALGLAAICELENAGVDTSYVETINKNTAISVEICNVIGDLQFARDDFAVMEELTPELISAKADVLDKAEAIFIDGSLPVETLNYISDQYSSKSKIYFDPGSVRGAKVFAESTLKADCVMPGRMEAEAMSGLSVLGLDQLMDAGDYFANKGIAKTVITLKGGGLYYNDADASGDCKSGIIKPPTNLGQVETSGAGDVVAAEIVMGLSKGENLENSAKNAIEAAAEYINGKNY